MIRVQELLASLGTDGANQAAEDYFAKIADPTHLLAKPYQAPHEAWRLLLSFGAVLSGLRLAAGMDVLELGAGPCWCAHALTQMGCRVYAVDVSPTAIGIGKRRYEQHPPFGNVPPAQLMVYDGHRLPLPDQSLDRILCFDAFHHFPNPEELLAEMFRVLRPDGIAGFSEPGPDHSGSVDAQYEMETYGVVENDVVVEDIWKQAREIGFARMDLSVYPIRPPQLSLTDYQRFIAGACELDAPVTEAVRANALETRTFFLARASEFVADSRSPEGLAGAMTLELHNGPELAPEEALLATAHVRNTGTASWLPGDTPFGGVKIGVHLLDRSGQTAARDYCRVPLHPGSTRALLPGDELTVRVRIPCPPPGEWELEVDLLAEGVVWFGHLGMPTHKLIVQVR